MRAYLVGRVNLTTSPPTVDHVGIYSDDPGSLSCDTKSERFFLVLHRDGPTYDKARTNLLNIINDYDSFSWVIPSSQKRIVTL